MLPRNDFGVNNRSSKRKNEMNGQSKAIQISKNIIMVDEIGISTGQWNDTENANRDQSIIQQTEYPIPQTLFEKRSQWLYSNSDSKDAHRIAS